MKAKITFLCIAFFVSVINLVSAEMVRGIDIDFVTVGNPGNASDPLTDLGAVDYKYFISKYEITNAQWNAFTEATGVPMGNPDSAYDSIAYFSADQQPTNNVSWYEAVQFCNYLTSGNKYSGVYQFDQSGNFLGVNRVSAQATYDQIYFLPTEDEWYKAAYHKNDGVTNNFWLYPTQSDVTPNNGLLITDPGNNANFYQSGYTIGSPDYLTIVGDFENSASAYGTFDQGGNVWEWVETRTYTHFGVWGSSYCNSVNHLIASSPSSVNPPSNEALDLGFRIASIPEPTTLLLLGLGGIALRKRRK